MRTSAPAFDFSTLPDEPSPAGMVLPAARRAAPGLAPAQDTSGVIAYVLDTNVLLHDTTALYQFAEHDVVLPMAVMEELDAHKKGLEDIARNARAVTRELARLIEAGGDLAQGVSLESGSLGHATGRLFLSHLDMKAMQAALHRLGLEKDKADNHILATTQALASSRAVVLVTKDVNLLVKARALGLQAQDYRTDRVLTDNDFLSAGYVQCDPDFWEQQADQALGEEIFFRSGRGPRASKAKVSVPLALNSFLVVKGDPRRLWRVQECGGDYSVLHEVPRQRKAPAGAKQGSSNKAAKNTKGAKGSADGAPLVLIEPRDVYQAMALDLLRDETVDIVSLLGIAGSGKTLLALATGLEQVKGGRYGGILLTRATVSMGDDIGFLPGTEEEKMGAWLGGTLDDCLEALEHEGLGRTSGSGPRQVPPEISIRSMSFMRGRSFQRKFIIIDEAQNLTQHQMRTLLTRAGDGTKIVLTGNTAQIDTPYLDEGSCGLVWAVKTLAGWEHAGHVILPRGVRSRLATFVEEHGAKRA